jgi:hypothetical protein
MDTKVWLVVSAPDKINLLLVWDQPNAILMTGIGAEIKVQTT